MSTWNVITITRHDGKTIDPDRMTRLVTRYVANLEVLVEGSSGTFDAEFDIARIWGKENGWQDRSNAVFVDGWSKCSLDGDWAKLSARLGPDWEIEVDEEWDDEGPGGSTETYVAGAVITDRSFTLRSVNDALTEVLDVSKPPQLWEMPELSARVHTFQPGTRFIAVPPKAVSDAGVV